MKMPEYSVKVDGVDIAIKTGKLIEAILRWWNSGKYYQSHGYPELVDFSHELDFVTMAKEIKKNMNVVCKERNK